MINPRLFIATAATAAAALSACSDTTAPGDLATQESASASARRSGTFYVEKNCDDFLTDDICTITLSTLKEIPKGTIVRYASDAVGASLDSDVRLDLPGRGKSTVFGHCTANLATGLGGCVFSGGTGKFKRFHAEVALTPLGGLNFAWNGSYSFSRRD